MTNLKAKKVTKKQETINLLLDMNNMFIRNIYSYNDKCKVDNLINSQYVLLENEGMTYKVNLKYASHYRDNEQAGFIFSVLEEVKVWNSNDKEEMVVTWKDFSQFFKLPVITLK